MKMASRWRHASRDRASDATCAVLAAPPRNSACVEPLAAVAAVDMPASVRFAVASNSPPVEQVCAIVDAGRKRVETVLLEWLTPLVGRALEDCGAMFLVLQGPRWCWGRPCGAATAPMSASA